MNVAVIYSSKYGCTTDCAKYLKAGLSAEVTLIDINAINSRIIALENLSNFPGQTNRRVNRVMLRVPFIF